MSGRAVGPVAGEAGTARRRSKGCYISHLRPNAHYFRWALPVGRFRSVPRAAASTRRLAGTLQQKVPQAAISGVISYDMAGSYALQPIGYLLAGPLAVAVGLSVVMIICASAALVVILSSLLVCDARHLGAEVSA